MPYEVIFVFLVFSTYYRAESKICKIKLVSGALVKEPRSGETFLITHPQYMWVLNATGLYQKDRSKLKNKQKT